MAWLFALSASHSTRTQLLVISCVGIIKSCFLAFASDVLRLRRDVEINFNIILWSFYLLNVCTLLFTIVISFSENRWHVLSPSNKFYTFHAIVGDTSIWLPYFNTANAPRGAKLYSCCSGIIKIFSSYALLRMSDAPKKIAKYFSSSHFCFFSSRFLCHCSFCANKSNWIFRTAACHLHIELSYTKCLQNDFVAPSAYEHFRCIHPTHILNSQIKFSQTHANMV